LPLDELVAAELRGWHGARRTVVESFERGVLGAVRARGVQARFVYLVDASGHAADSATAYDDEVAGDLGALGMDGISVDKSRLLADPGLVGRAHDAGLLAFTWTLRPENRFLGASHRTAGRTSDWGDWMAEYRAVIATGVDGVFADHPDLAIVARDGL
ncbi:MAG TPA: glycerophosphodiester phosphodiesterase family protein, partial [Pseudolysinimonas sp.]|nr:glycerophosphodiester phosphodiesterase family protein [Pseudolysinimonas sp.]